MVFTNHLTNDYNEAKKKLDKQISHIKNNPEQTNDNRLILCEFLGRLKDQSNKACKYDSVKVLSQNGELFAALIKLPEGEEPEGWTEEWIPAGEENSYYVIPHPAATFTIDKRAFENRTRHYLLARFTANNKSVEFYLVFNNVGVFKGASKYYGKPETKDPEKIIGTHKEMMMPIDELIKYDDVFFFVETLLDEEKYGYELTGNIFREILNPSLREVVNLNSYVFSPADKVKVEIDVTDKMDWIKDKVEKYLKNKTA